MKIGDWVTVRSTAWYICNKNYYGDVVREGVKFIPSMANLCGMKLQVVAVNDDKTIQLSMGPHGYPWMPWMFEDAYESSEPITQVAESIGIEPSRTKLPKGKKSCVDGKCDIS